MGIELGRSLPIDLSAVLSLDIEREDEASAGESSCRLSCSGDSREPEIGLPLAGPYIETGEAPGGVSYGSPLRGEPPLACDSGRRRRGTLLTMLCRQRRGSIDRARCTGVSSFWPSLGR